MRRFSFKLERLLRLREHAEKDWETKLGEVTSRCNVCRRKIDMNNRAHSRILSERAGNTSLDNLIVSELYMKRMRESVISLRQDLLELDKEREGIQKKFLEASRERKILQKLKERKEQEFYKEQIKEEMKVLDDINTSAAARKAVV